jgi:NarL family two-component system sensor histidine kinase LiaS
MKLITSFFKGLRARLTLTYTLVTVLALLALELAVVIPLAVALSLVRSNLGGYMNDAQYVLYPQASKYLQPGKEDLPGLQAWLEGVYRSGYASLPPQRLSDNPSAAIVNSLVGRKFAQPDYYQGNLYTRDPHGNYLLEIPVWQDKASSPMVGTIVLTVAPPPTLAGLVWALFAGGVILTALLLLVGVTPFGALFGFVMSRGLTQRLARLTAAADAWSEGNFAVQPEDNASDEISNLGQRMRHMAERIQALLQAGQELAALEERNRLARELHDTVKQHTFATLMQVRAARNLLGDQANPAVDHLLEAEALLKTSQQELGLLITELRPAALEGKGLAGALQEYLETWSQHACIPADFEVKNARPLPFDVEQALFRVAQEALANVARHSRASAVSVRLELTPEAACLEIRDNGVGYNPEEKTTGFGLNSMRQRMAAVGGSIGVESSPGSGAAIRAALPFGKDVP